MSINFWKGQMSKTNKNLKLNAASKSQHQKLIVITNSVTAITSSTVTVLCTPI